MIASCTEWPSYRNESPVCTEWAFLRTRSSLVGKYEYMFVMGCKAKGDFTVREHYTSPEEPSNQFASAYRNFYVILGKSLTPKCPQLALLLG